MDSTVLHPTGIPTDDPVPATQRAGTDKDRTGTIQVSFMKNPKRKRLAKACDACHKSKRRCDGTAPCSNCFFASKECTYTDASGRPVPAPKASEPMPQRSKDFHRPSQVASEHLPILPRQVMEVANICQPEILSSPYVRLDPSCGATDSKKRHRADSGASEAASEHQWGYPDPEGRTAGLDAKLVRELVGLFFTHCHPHRMIIHMPSFVAALSRSAVPPYLILAICAVAAPFSKSSQVKMSPPRLAGTRFLQEAVKLMFDPSGRLIREPDLATVQALCLLECHEVNAQYSWAKCFRYNELASKIIREMLEVHRADTPTLSTLISTKDLDVSSERECLRRCFWLIYFMDMLTTICTRLPTRVPPYDISIRLPMDETSFEMGFHATPEYLNKPAPRNNCASEIGHLLRLITIYARAEDCLDLEDEEMVREGLLDVVKTLDDWGDSLPDHLRFTEENIQLQQSMFETSANMGAWCFYYIHSLQACCMVSVAKMNQGMCDSAHPTYSSARSCITRIMSSLGSRAINSNYLVGSILWALSRHCGEDPDMQALDAEYERIWGFKCLEVAPTWRKRNHRPRKPEERPAQPITHAQNNREFSLRPIDPGGNLGRDCHHTQSDRRGSIDGRNDRNVDVRQNRTDDARRGGDGDMKNDRESLPSLKAVGLLDSFGARTETALTNGMKGWPPFSATTGIHW